MLARLLVLLLGIALALVCGELLLRVVGYPGAAERQLRRFDARYGAVARDSWIWSFQIDPERHHAVDLRGQWIELAKPRDETRVLFVGDSATEGAFVDLAESYPRVFKALLDERQPHNRVQVINAGVWGMTSVDEFHLLQDKLLPLRPDVVVIGLFMANDINMNLAHRERVANATSWFDALRTHSALVHFFSLQALVLNARQRVLRSEGVSSHEQASGAEHTWSTVDLGLIDSYGLHMLSYPAGELATYMRPTSSLMEHAFDVLEQVLGDFMRLGRAHGFKVRVLLIPSPSRVLGRLAILHYPRILEQLEQQGVHIDPGLIDVDAPTRRVLSICSRLDLDCVDPTPRLSRLGARAFFPDDEHPTVAGHRALAEALLLD